MHANWGYRLQLHIEKLLLRGLYFRLLFIALAICFISAVGGVLVISVSEEMSSIAEGAWWAFLHLSDPGYLGDDHGLGRRIVATVLTILGYVFFMGALVAIMTQWLHAFVNRLERGETPIVLKNHFVILGWTETTPLIVRELMLSSGRVRRFLRQFGRSRFHVAILVEDLDSEKRSKLRRILQSQWKESAITLRNGSRLSIEDIERVSAFHAAAIILPAPDSHDASEVDVDTQTIKTLLSLANHPLVEDRSEMPRVVVEILDPRKAVLATSAFEGPLEVISSETTLGRLIAQNIRHPRLSYIYTDILSQESGVTVHTKLFPELAGRTFAEVRRLFREATLLGVIRYEERARALMNPAESLVLEERDRYVFLAKRFEDIETVTEMATPATLTFPAVPSVVLARRRILILGWSRAIIAILQELERYEGEEFEVDVLSVVSAKEREELLHRYDLELQRVRVRQVEGDYSVESQLRRIDPEHYDNILVLSSDWIVEGEEVDARSLLGFLLLKRILGQSAKTLPSVLVELSDPGNALLFERQVGEVVVSRSIVGHLLAQTSMRPELALLFEEFFTVGGAEFCYRDVEQLGLSGQRHSIESLQEAARASEELVVGYLSASEQEFVLNPAPEYEREWNSRDRIVLLRTA